MRNIASSSEIAAEKFRKERVQTYLSIETCKTFFFRNQNLQRQLSQSPQAIFLTKKKKQKAGAERLGTTIVIREGLVMSILILSFAPKIFFFFSIFFSVKQPCATPYGRPTFGSVLSTITLLGLPAKGKLFRKYKFKSLNVRRRYLTN